MLYPDDNKEGPIMARHSDARFIPSPPVSFWSVYVTDEKGVTEELGRRLTRVQAFRLIDQHPGSFTSPAPLFRSVWAQR